MDVHEALRTRRTIHFYKTDPLPEGAIQSALEAAHQAPNHKMTIPWRFTRLGRETRKRLDELSVALKMEKRGKYSEDAAARIRKKREDPPELWLVTRVVHANPVVAREDYASCACAIQNFMLALHAWGVGTKWSTGGLCSHEGAYEILGVDPDEEEIVGYVWAGFPDKVPAPKRPDLQKVVRELP